MKGLRIIIWGILLFALAAGCRRIPMHERGSGVYIRISVDQSLDQSMEESLVTNPSLRDKVAGKMPEMVRICFYDVVSHELVSEDFLPSGGGFVDIEAGIYDIVIYSLGTEVTQVSGTEKRAGAFAFTDATGVRVRPHSGQAKDDGIYNQVSTEEQPVIFEPDHLFAGIISGAVVPVRPDDAETVVLSADLSRVSETWTLEIPYIEGTKRIRNAEVYITGQADGRFLWDRRTTGHPCAIALESGTGVQDGQIKSVFNTFGKYPQADSDVLVMVLVTTNSGARCLYVYDVTDQWLNPDNSTHRLIFEETMEIPDDDYQGGEVDPVATDWEGVVIPVLIEC